MQYNLIRNSVFKSLTISGTGNISLTASELAKLYDNNLTSSGVSVVSSGVLYLEADLAKRIKVDGIRLYADDLSKKSNIKFYYKNSESDNYTILTTYSGSQYYYTNVPSPSAPRYILTTVSGVNIELYELQIFNDDYIVGFGEDGNETEVFLSNMPIASVSNSVAVAIYNNSSIPVDAYTCVDYTESDLDFYLEIANNVGGPYYSLNDGVILNDNYANSKYIWNMGVFDNTKVVNSSVVADGASGYYTTPIFDLEDSVKASYFITIEDKNSGLISFDDTVDGTIKVRSSNTEPLIVNRIFWPARNSNTLDMYDVVTDQVTQNIISYDIPAYPQTIYGTTVNRYNGRIAYSIQYESSGSENRIYVYNSNYAYIDYYMISNCKKFNVLLEFDSDNGVWGYGTAGEGSYKRLVRVNNNYDSTSCNIASADDFLYDGCVEWGGVNLWYTNKLNNTLNFIDYAGNSIYTIPLSAPRAICATEDGGCWVVDTGISAICRYDANGIKIDEMAIPSGGVSRMKKDFDGGFWCINSSSVTYVNEDKEISFSLDGFTNLARIVAGHSCCVVFSYTNDKLWFINLKTRAIEYEWQGSWSSTKMPGLLSFSLSDSIEYHKPYSAGIFPHDSDPVWGSSGIEWKEVPKNNYFLSKARYHQLKYRIVGDAALNSIILAPSVKSESIQPSSYRNVYIRTDIPAGVDISNYEARLKTWWED